MAIGQDLFSNLWEQNMAVWSSSRAVSEDLTEIGQSCSRVDDSLVELRQWCHSPQACSSARLALAFPDFLLVLRYC